MTDRKRDRLTDWQFGRENDSDRERLSDIEIDWIEDREKLQSDTLNAQKDRYLTERLKEIRQK